MSFYRACMRNASLILFWIAVIIVAANVTFHFYVFVETRAAVESGRVTMSPPPAVSDFVFSLMSSLGSAALPLFGAAALWRADRWLDRGAVSAEAAE